MDNDLTTRQAADQLGINHRTLLSWINSERLLARKALFGQGWRFSRNDLDLIRKWRAGNPSEPLNLVKAAKGIPERVLPPAAMHARPDLKLYGEYYPKTKSWAYGPEHPYVLLGDRTDKAMTAPPWSILESPEYLEALEAHRAKPQADPRTALLAEHPGIFGADPDWLPED